MLIACEVAIAIPQRQPQLARVEPEKIKWRHKNNDNILEAGQHVLHYTQRFIVSMSRNT